MSQLVEDNSIVPEPTAPAPAPGFSELFGMATKKNFLMSAKDSYDELMSYGKPVEGYKPTYDDVSKMQKDMGLTEEQGKILSGALSPEELQFRAQKFQEQNDNKKALDTAGWKGVAAEMLSYAVDPVMLPSYAIKTPIMVGRALETIGVKFAQNAVTGAIERATGAGVVGLGTGVAQEGVLSMYDPNRSVDDVITAGASGLIGGVGFSMLADGAGALLRRATGRRAVGEAMQEAVETTDWTSHADMMVDADKSLNAVITNRLLNSDYARHFDGLEGQIPDPVARKRVLTEGQAINKMVDDLTPTAEARMSRGERMEMESNIRSGDYNAQQLQQRIAEIEATPVSGSGKNLAAARAARSAELSGLRQQMAQQQADVQALRTTIEPHKSGEFAQAVRDINNLRQGIIPEHLKAKYLDLITPDDAAPAFSEARSNLPEAKEQAPQVLPEEAKRVESEELSLTGDKPEADTSVGAKEAENVILFRDTEGDLISSTMGTNLDNMRKLGEQIPVVRAAGTTSIYGRVMARMKDNSLRGLAGLVFNDPHGARTSIQSSAAWSDLQRQRISPKFSAIENMAMDAHLASLNINQLLQPGKANEAIIDFSRQVSLAIDRLTDTVIKDTDSNVVKAAKARATAYREALEVAKLYGVRGFEGVEARASYQSVIIGRNDMTSALDRFGEDEVRETLVRGYMGAKKPLTQKSATLVADAYMDRYYRGTSAVVSKSSKPSNTVALQAVADELKASGVDEKEIQTVLNMLEGKQVGEGISARAMDSLHPNINATSMNGLRFVDLMDTSTAGVDKYVRELTASASFARYGLTSRRQVEDTITEAFKRHRQEISDLANQYKEAVERKAKLAPGVDTSRVDKIIADYERLGNMDKYRKFLDDFEEDFFDGVKVAFGEPIQEPTFGVQASSALGKIVNLELLGFSGVAQVADIGITVARSGLGAVLRNLPTTLYHGVRSMLPSQKYFMKNDELNQIAEIMGSISHQDFLFGHKMMNGAEYGDAVVGHASRLDKALDKVNWLQSSFSLLRPIQGAIDELSARSLLTNVVNLSKGKAFTGKTRKSFLEVGKMSEESLDKSLAHINSEMGRGKDLFAAVRTMDPILRDELGTAIRTVHTSNIGRSYFGEMPAFTNKAMGKMFMKLQTFALTSYEKAVQRGLRHDQAGLIAATVWSAGIASIFVDVDVRVQALKQPEHKRDEYVTKRTDDERAYTIAGRMSQVAMFSNVAQLYNVVNPYQDSWMKPFGEYRGIAPMGGIGKIGQAGAAAGRLASEESTDEEADKYKVYGAIPLLNTVVGMAVLNSL